MICIRAGLTAHREVHLERYPVTVYAMCRSRINSTWGCTCKVPMTKGNNPNIGRINNTLGVHLHSIGRFLSQNSST
jgi:hypothetical protein